MKVKWMTNYVNIFFEICVNLQIVIQDDQHQWNGSQPFPKTLMDRVTEIVKDPPVRKSTCNRGQRLSGSR